MLTRLLITNYALINHLEITLHNGLTIITGETGAGKSIILGALGLLLGGRLPIRETLGATDNARKTIVEATFSVAGYDLKPLFDDNDIDYDEQVCILRREVTANGRTRAFVNDTPVAVAVLRTVGTRLVDIHSQHSNMLLADPDFRIDVLDSLADNESTRARYSATFTALLSARKRLATLEQSRSKAIAEEDYLRFQVEQLSSLNLHRGEDAELEAVINRLSNVERLKDELFHANALLNADEQSVPDMLRCIEQHLRRCQDAMPELSETADRVHSAMLDIKDVAAFVDSAQENLSFDPAEYERANDRLAAIYNLQRKHGVDNSDALLDLQQNLEQQLMAIDGTAEDVEQARQTVEHLTAEATTIAQMLTNQRCEAAKRFETELLTMAVPLGLKNLSFRVQREQQPLGPKGADKIHLLAAFNKNRPMTDVGETASGGEISRLMLCVKAITARTMHLPTLVFDEVDTGVSGDVATRMGELMAATATHLQVIAITHLPQVAAQSNHHLLVYKTDNSDATVTGVRTLSDDEHLLEVARMLSGHDVGTEAIENARALIDSRSKYSSSTHTSKSNETKTL